MRKSPPATSCAGSGPASSRGPTGPLSGDMSPGAESCAAGEGEGPVGTMCQTQTDNVPPQRQWQGPQLASRFIGSLSPTPPSKSQGCPRLAPPEEQRQEIHDADGGAVVAGAVPGTGGRRAGPRKPNAMAASPKIERAEITIVDLLFGIPPHNVSPRCGAVAWPSWPWGKSLRQDLVATRSRP